jgi:ABC-type multidrug transport system ATPase subunit
LPNASDETTAAALLRVADMSVRRGGRNIIDGVSFTAQRGEILGVIGPNGAGKTTLFESVTGLLPVDRGEVSVDGVRLAPSERKRALFYMPDAIRPWPEQGVRWTLQLLHDLLGGSGEVDVVLRELDLERLASQSVRSLSKGETKRLDIALALLSPLPLVFLDEPFDGLDLRQTRQAIELLRAFVKRGTTLVLSIHQLIDAARACDRLLLLDHGRAVAEGTVDELREHAGVSGDLEEVFLALT